MVRQVTEYECEYPNCHRRYGTREEAEKCEAQGLIGPEIEPGLVLKINYANPEICPETFAVIGDELPLRSHHRKYGIINLNLGKKGIEGSVSCHSTAASQITYNLRGVYLQVTPRDLDRLNIAKVREKLLERCVLSKCERLYREHPMFEENARQEGGRE